MAARAARSRTRTRRPPRCSLLPVSAAEAPAAAPPAAEAPAAAPPAAEASAATPPVATPAASPVGCAPAAPPTSPAARASSVHPRAAGGRPPPRAAPLPGRARLLGPHPGRLDELVVLHAGRAGGHAGHAAQAPVEVLGSGRRQLGAAADLAHQAA